MKCESSEEGMLHCKLQPLTTRPRLGTRESIPTDMTTQVVPQSIQTISRVNNEIPNNRSYSFPMIVWSVWRMSHFVHMA